MNICTERDGWSAASLSVQVKTFSSFYISLSLSPFIPFNRLSPHATLGLLSFPLLLPVCQKLVWHRA